MNSTPGRPGRPPLGGPVVAVRIGSHAAAWCDGELAGAAWLIAEARAAADCAQPVPLGVSGPAVPADLVTPLGAAAALMSANPYRAVLVEAPADVLAEITGSGCLVELGARE